MNVALLIHIWRPESIVFYWSILNARVLTAKLWRPGQERFTVKVYTFAADSDCNNSYHEEFSILTHEISSNIDFFSSPIFLQCTLYFTSAIQLQLTIHLYRDVWLKEFWMRRGWIDRQLKRWGRETVNWFQLLGIYFYFEFSNYPKKINKSILSS